MLSAAEQFALGEKRRKAIRRADHAGWDVAKRRESPLKLMAASMVGRVTPLVALKYERMAVSPFGYFRGAVPVMAYDLSLLANTEMTTQLCGDAHVRNLGAYAGPDGRLVFDINDFDETIVGPFEWDVKRMATSLILAGREAGAKHVQCREAAAVFLEQYRTTMWEMSKMSKMPVLGVARYQVHRLRSVTPVDGILRMAERATPLHSLEALTEPVVAARAAKKSTAKKVASKSESEVVLKDSARRFKTLKPVLTRVTGLAEQQVLDSLTMYAQCLEPQRRHLLEQYRPLDVAFKVVGTGSVGLRDYVVYLQGNGVKDPLFLQVKEESESAYARYVGRKSKEHQGRRVVEGEKAMQLQSDPFLGWTSIDGREYLVRQLNDHKASIQMEDLKAAGLMEYAGVCGGCWPGGMRGRGAARRLRGI